MMLIFLKISAKSLNLHFLLEDLEVARAHFIESSLDMVLSDEHEDMIVDINKLLVSTMMTI